MGQEIVAYEREPFSLFNFKSTDDVSDFLIIEIRMTQPRKSGWTLGLTSTPSPIGYSRLHCFRKDWTVRKLRLRIYEIMRPLVKNVIGKKGIKQMDLEPMEKSKYG